MFRSKKKKKKRKKNKKTGQTGLNNSAHDDQKRQKSLEKSRWAVLLSEEVLLAKIGSAKSVYRRAKNKHCLERQVLLITNCRQAQNFRAFGFIRMRFGFSSLGPALSSGLDPFQLKK